VPQTHPHPDVDRVLLDEQQIRDRLAELGAQIAADSRTCPRSSWASSRGR
jgi:hypoxanthine-guanine phosphoribosyltransferase